MHKHNNRSAAGSRRSAIAERIKMREEWSELKGTTENIQPKSVLQSRNFRKDAIDNNRPKLLQPEHIVSGVLSGVLAVVEVGMESKALPLRAALTALGATVVPVWGPLVTHVIWSDGGCRATRAKARALASRLVSPLWVEACAASAKRLPEHAFPASARPSDLPSPKTLRRMLRRAEQENIPLVNMLCDDSKEDDGDGKRAPRLRISSETERDTSTNKTTDTSLDTSHDKSRHDKDVDPMSRVNTAPRRRAHPVAEEKTPEPSKSKSRRKLFTQKEGEDLSSDDDDEDGAPKRIRPCKKLTQRERKDFARAERMARRLATLETPAKSTAGADNPLTQLCNSPRIVLTGMPRSERHLVHNAIRTLNGHIHKKVSRKTTHILMGSCRDDAGNCDTSRDAISVTQKNRSKIANSNISVQIPLCDRKARTLNALEGAARGCRVLYAQWAMDSLAKNQWIHQQGFEVQQLKKISQKARIERKILGKQKSEYAYNVFCGMRVWVTPDTDQKDAATLLLKLCGAVVQDGGQQSADCDVTLGTRDGQVGSKWVFDSVAAARMRTTRRYIHNSVANTVEAEMSQMTGIHRLS